MATGHARMTILRGRRVLITGPAGFVGANLVETLYAAGADVHGIVRPSTDRWRLDGQASRPTLHEADSADADAVGGIVRDVRPDVLYHAAAGAAHPSTPSARRSALSDTILSTAAVCEALAAAGRGGWSTSAVRPRYGQAPVPLDEARALTPVTFRGAAKAGATLICRQMALEAGTPVVLLRLFSVARAVGSRVTIRADRHARVAVRRRGAADALGRTTRLRVRA